MDSLIDITYGTVPIVAVFIVDRLFRQMYKESINLYS